MKRNLFISIVFVVFLTSCATKKRAVPPKTVEKTTPSTSVNKGSRKSRNRNVHTVTYIKKYAPLAIKKMKEYKIPASITLAQGVLESGSGRSRLAVKSKNHFGIKCHKKWKGKRVFHDDDKEQECFRKYKYVADSYTDHSKFLTGRKRYAPLFRLKSTDYKGWAWGLKKAGYATDKNYPKKLIKIIEDYELYRLDRLRRKDKKQLRYTVATPTYYVVQGGDTLYSIARAHNTTVQRLKELNQMKGTRIRVGQRLLLGK